MRGLSMKAALLGAVLSLAACGGSDAETSPSVAIQEIDACALLTAAEVEAATGVSPGPPEAVRISGGPPICNWPAADGSNAAFLTVLVAPTRHFESYDAALAMWQESAAGAGMDFDPADYEEVEGVGDVGAWLREAEMLQAHRGDRMVQVATRVAPDRDVRQASIELARHALTRLD